MAAGAPIDFAARVCLRPSPRAARRLLASVWRQSGRSTVCPDKPRLDGQLALVTGGARGIGLATSRGLAARGAELVMAARGEADGHTAAEAIRREQGVAAHFVSLDLADLDALPGALARLEAALAGRPLDVLVANAGLWPLRPARSAQGHELAFATNVLGHHALIQAVLERGWLRPGARVVVVTGDIYVLARDCSADYRYRGALGGQQAYCRSKLGNLWMVRELARRNPGLRVHAVHPGVVASELGVAPRGVLGRLRDALTLSLEQGAQTTLFCATQPDLPSGSYWHNTLGRMDLHPDDAAADAARAAALWDELERLRRS